MDQFDEADLDALAPQERAAIEEDDSAAPDAAALAQIVFDEPAGAPEPANPTEAWERECRRFIAFTAATEGIDYGADRDLLAKLDTEVRRLAADEANAERLGEWFLEHAHRRVQEALKAASDASSEGDGGGQGAMANGDFSRLDTLRGLELEAALARLTPEEQERYANEH